VASREVSATAQQIAVAAGGQAEMAGELQVVASSGTDQATPPQPLTEPLPGDIDGSAGAIDPRFAGIATD
jgi:hypothetical protein